jgi:hypothetical protein
MQPSSDQGSSRWAAAPTGAYARPGYAPAPPAVSVTSARPVPIGLAAMATMLLLMLAVDNSAVTDSIDRHAFGSDNFFSRVLVALTAFRWDLGRLSPDPQRIYLGQLLADIVILLLVLLLVVAVTRGRGSFGHVFIATWVAVIAASQIGTYVRSAIVQSGQITAGENDRPTVIFFSAYSPGAVTLFASIVFGFVVALVAGFIGVRTRRTEVLTGGEAPARREPWSAPPPAGAGSAPPAAPGSPPPGAPGPVSDPSPWSAADSDEGQTTQLPPVEQRPRHAFDDGEQHTIQLPPADDDGSSR